MERDSGHQDVPAMIAAATRFGAMVAILVTLATTIQVLYLESLRIHARELPSLEFFKDTLESKIGLATELGALTFSLVKHLGLAVIGCLILAITMQSAADWEALGGPAARGFMPSWEPISFRRSSIANAADGAPALGSVVSFGGVADAAVDLGAQVPAIRVRFGRPSAGRRSSHAGRTHRQL